MSAYHLNVTVHLLAAFVWLGGMFFLAAVGAPALRELEDPTLRARLFAAIGRRFRVAGWMAIGVLLVTGVLNLYFRGLLDSGTLGDPAFWASPYGRALGWKLGAVAAMILVSALHDFVFGPRVARAWEGGGEARAGDAAGVAEAAGGADPPGSRDRRVASWLARASALLGIAVVVAAVRLARGG